MALMTVVENRDEVRSTSARLGRAQRRFRNASSAWTA